MRKLALSLTAVVILIAAMLACSTFIGCSDYDDDYVYDGKALVGKWQEVELDEGNYKIYQFYADGTVTYASCLYGMIPDGYVTAKYKIEGNNTLVLTERINGKTEVSRMKFSINEDGILVLVSPIDEEEINKLEPYKLDYDEASPIMGKWVHKNVKNGVEQSDLFWFCDNSDCFIFPNVSGKIGDDVDEFIRDYINSEVGFIDTMLYSTRGGKIYICFADDTLISEKSVVFGEYKIIGNKLIISSEGEAILELERYDE